jgi:tRNA (guanine37-N1)-methyltransferase
MSCNAVLRIDVLTLFPGICEGALGESIMRRAQEKQLVAIAVHNLRDWAKDKHHITDDTPYGGGPGMVLKPEPIGDALDSLRSPQSKVLLMSPSGRRFTQQIAAEYARESHLIVVCGHYEGVDQRIVDHLINDEISIGDYVLTNGALAAAVFIDAVVRLLPGVLGHEQSAVSESFSKGMLDYPQYTRPPEYRGWRVPEILLSGNHAQIERWRREQALKKTRRNRPDLLGEKE